MATQTMRNTLFYVLIATGLIVMTLWAFVLGFIPEKTSILNYLFNLCAGFIYLTGGLYGIFGFFKKVAQGNLRKAFFFIGCGLTSYSTANFIWFYANTQHISVPYPSLADVFYVPVFAFFIVLGFFYLFSMYAQMITPRIVIQAILIIIISGIAILGILDKPDLSSISFMARLLNVAYPLVDTILLSLILIIARVSGGNLQRGVKIMLLGFCIQVIADILFTYRTAHGIYWNGDIADYFYALSAITLSSAVIDTFLFFRQKALNTI
jgi:two-component system, sensor histidine kinase PdtaS